MDSLQHTIKRPVSFAGIGLHSGKVATLSILPGEENSGIRFVRSDLPQAQPTPAFMDRMPTLNDDGTMTNFDLPTAYTEALV